MTAGRALVWGARATAALAVVAGADAPAWAQERFSVDASIGAGVAKNPFLEAGDTPVVASATLKVTPSYSLDDGLTRFVLTGDAAITEYAQRYRNSDSFALTGAASHRLSTRNSVSARVGYLNSVVGAFNDLVAVGMLTPGLGVSPIAAPDAGAGTGVDIPVQPLPVVVVDPTINPSLGGIGRRRQSYSGGAGMNLGLGARDRLDLDLNLFAIRTSGRSLDDYNYVTQRVGYRRAIDQGFDITADVLVSRADYLGRRQNDATVIQPTVGTSYRIAENLSLDLSVGVAIVRTDLAAAGATRTNTSFSAQGRLCKQDSRTSSCFALSRTALPSAIDGVRVQTAASISASMRTSERGSASVSTSYSRSSEPLSDITLGGLVPTRTEFLSVRGDYSHRLSPRLAGFVSVGGARVYDRGTLSRDPSYDVRAGLRIRIGALR